MRDGRETDVRRYLLAALVVFAGALAHAQTLYRQERYAILDQQERCAMQAKQSFEEIRVRQAQN
jgi:Tfp pilus assembly protein PilV